MQPNWFVAWPIVLDSGFELPPSPPGMRIFHEADRHVTAAFLGSCGEEAARAVYERAREIDGPIARGSLGAMAALGNPERPSSLAALIETGNEALREILVAHREAWLRIAGRGPDRYPPLPHCTLGRMTRRASEPERRAGVAWGLQLSTIGVGFTLRPTALYTWSEDRSDRLFRIVEPG